MFRKLSCCYWAIADFLNKPVVCALVWAFCIFMLGWSTGMWMQRQGDKFSAEQERAREGEDYREFQTLFWGSGPKGSLASTGNVGKTIEVDDYNVKVTEAGDGTFSADVTHRETGQSASWSSGFSTIKMDKSCRAYGEFAFGQGRDYLLVDDVHAGNFRYKHIKPRHHSF